MVKRSTSHENRMQPRGLLALQTLLSLNSFAASLIVHLALVVGLALMAVPSLRSDGEKGASLVSDPGVESELELPTLQPELSPSLVLKSDVSEVASSGGAFPSLEIEELAIDGKVLANAQGVESSGVFAQTVSAGKSSKKGLEINGASFYGVEAVGEKFVFVVDSSSSMEGPRWNSARQELIKSIESLGPDQKFFAICFDVEARPIFGNVPPKNKYLLPNTRMVGRVKSWLKQIELGASTRPANALALAISMEPDAIYLLSDGEIRDQSQMMLTQINRDEDGKTKIPIHTISLLSTEGRYTLMQIANENGGTFTNIDRNP